MARSMRIESAGFHHIINRGVNKKIIFDSVADKEKFLEIVCEVSSHYDFKIHGYVIMSNHYHLILENQRENLSHGMRQINATYAQYYNKKYKRIGPLWQGRFKSRYIFDTNYLFVLFKYLEFNPITAKITKKLEQHLKLEDYFCDNMSKQTRNEAIMRAYLDGFMQSEIAKFLGLSGAVVSKILKKIKS